MTEFSSAIIGGEKIPLTLQLDDGSSGFYPRVTITDDLNNGVDVVQLNDRGFGLYTGKSNISMPVDVDYVVAQFVVYADPLFQNIATNYSVEIERFDRIDPEEFKGKFEQVTIGERVFANVSDDEFIFGAVKDNDRVSGVVEEIEETTATIKDDKIETTIKDDSEVKGKI